MFLRNRLTYLYYEIPIYHSTFYYMILIYIMYSTRAIAKKEQNGKYEIIKIQRGRTSENDIDIEIKFCGFSPFADLHLANYDWGSVPGKN